MEKDAEGVIVKLYDRLIVGSFDWGIVGSLGRYYVVNIDPTVVAVRHCEERYKNLSVSLVLMRSAAIPKLLNGIDKEIAASADVLARNAI